MPRQHHRDEHDDVAEGDRSNSLPPAHAPGHEARSQPLSVSSSTPLVSIHALKQVNGKIHVLLINKNPSEAYTVSVSLNGASAHGVARVFSYGKADAAIQKSSLRVRGSSFAVRVAPYSMTTVQLP